jgi:hypothetical protein
MALVAEVDKRLRLFTDWTIERLKKVMRRCLGDVKEGCALNWPAVEEEKAGNQKSSLMRERTGLQLRREGKVVLAE